MKISTTLYTAPSVEVSELITEAGFAFSTTIDQFDLREEI